MSYYDPASWLKAFPVKIRFPYHTIHSLQTVLLSKKKFPYPLQVLLFIYIVFLLTTVSYTPHLTLLTVYCNDSGIVCYNGGRCNGSSYSCICPPGYSGSSCEYFSCECLGCQIVPWNVGIYLPSHTTFQCLCHQCNYKDDCERV